MVAKREGCATLKASHSHFLHRNGSKEKEPTAASHRSNVGTELDKTCKSGPFARRPPCRSGRGRNERRQSRFMVSSRLSERISAGSRSKEGQQWQSTALMRTLSPRVTSESWRSYKIERSRRCASSRLSRRGCYVTVKEASHLAAQESAGHLS